MINVARQIYVNFIHAQTHIENPVNGLNMYIYYYSYCGLMFILHPHGRQTQGRLPWRLWKYFRLSHIKFEICLKTAVCLDQFGSFRGFLLILSFFLRYSGTQHYSSGKRKHGVNRKECNENKCLHIS